MFTLQLYYNVKHLLNIHKYVDKSMFNFNEHNITIDKIK